MKTLSILALTAAALIALACNAAKTTDSSDEDAKEQIVKVLAEKGEMKASDVASVIGKSSKRTRALLGQMVEAGRVERQDGIGAGFTTHGYTVYRLAK